MTRPERLAAILDLLAARGSVSVEELVEDLGISPATARRDLDSLAQQRLLSRTRGGATASSVAYDLPVKYHRADFADRKLAIAQAASALIDEGDVVGLCGGTTSTALAGVLATRDDLNKPSHSPTLTIVTNAINIAAQLAVRPNFKIMVTGGVLNPRSYELVGPFTDVVLQKVTIDKAFIGVNGIDLITGPTIIDEGEAAVNTFFASRAREAYVVADASKIGRRAFAAMTDFDFRRLITDSSIRDDQLAALRSLGIEVTVAPSIDPEGAEGQLGNLQALPWRS